MDATIELAKLLIEKQSITPNDCGCQDLIIERLQALGFQCHQLSNNGVTNFRDSRHRIGFVDLFRCPDHLTGFYIEFLYVLVLSLIVSKCVVYMITIKKRLSDSFVDSCREYLTWKNLWPCWSLISSMV